MKDPTFYLEGVVKEKGDAADFEGPLSLILVLLSKNKIEIRDISVSNILDQYLAYINDMQEMDMEVASEFVQMAAFLLYIKTKTLLDTDKEITELEQLMLSLEQLKCRDIRESIKSVVPEFAEASARGLLLYTRAPEPLSPAGRAHEYKHTTEDLLEALISVFSRPGAKPPAPPEYNSIAPRRIVYSVRDKCAELFRLLSINGRTPLRSLFSAGKSRTELVATFIAVLEMCSAGGVVLEDGDDGPVISATCAKMDDILADYEE